MFDPEPEADARVGHAAPLRELAGIPYIGGEQPGLAGGRARGKKVLTGIASEVREPKGLGRCRMLHG